MAYIKMIDPVDANDELKQVYEKVIGERGKLSNILKIHSLIPQTMIAHLELYMSIMFDKSILSREDKELIATVVSSTNKCEYCVNHHAEALKHYWKDDEKVKLVALNFRKVGLSDKQYAMLEFTEKLTHHPEEEMKGYKY